jgi:hypothetical protein
VERICLSNGSQEIFDPGILNPDEQLILHLNAGVPLQSDETIRIVIATGNGVTSQCLATG